MTPQQIELHIIDLVRQLAAQAQSDYSSVKLEVNISTGKESETIRPEWGCYTPTYGWTQGKTFGGAMEAQGDKLKRRAELIAKAQEMMAEAAKLETQTNLSARPKYQSVHLMEILRDGVVIATVENERLKSVLASMQNPESNQEPT